jgi:hypothetical protein
MATLDDLPILNLSSLDDEEGMRLILEMRLRRKFVESKPVRERKSKGLPSEATIAKLSEKQLAELYYTLMAKRQENLI